MALLFLKNLDVWQIDTIPIIEKFYIPQEDSPERSITNNPAKFSNPSTPIMGPIFDVYIKQTEKELDENNRMSAKCS